MTKPEWSQTAETMVSEGYLADVSDLVVRDSGGFAFWDGKNVVRLDASGLRARGVLGTLLADAFEAGDGVQVALLSQAPYVRTAAKAGCGVRPMLDDQAQLIGPTLPVVKASSTRVKRTLKKRSAVLVANTGCLCAAPNAYDAHAVAMVAEKGCRATIESSYLGGGKIIRYHEAWLMRMIYLTKYSKKAAG
ncbi:MAG: hypothetical protein MI717_10155 [Spirochaetales bacterium]|nr:hypothetical protein [Spirochaetales bacterium]